MNAREDAVIINSLVRQADVIAVISNCPQELNPAAGGRPTPVRGIVGQVP